MVKVKQFRVSDVALAVARPESGAEGGMVDGVKRERLREGRCLRTMDGGGGGRRSQRQRLLWCFFIEG